MVNPGSRLGALIFSDPLRVDFWMPKLTLVLPGGSGRGISFRIKRCLFRPVSGTDIR